MSNIQAAMAPATASRPANAGHAASARDRNESGIASAQPRSLRDVDVASFPATDSYSPARQQQLALESAILQSYPGQDSNSEHLLPGALRVAIIVGSSLIGWAAIIASAISIFG